VSALDPRVELDAELNAHLESEFPVETASRRRNLPPVSVLLALVFLALVVLCAIFGSHIAPHNPEAQDLSNALQPAGGGHLLGTDDFGRDVLSRVIAGARTALVGPLLVALGAMLIGSLFGLLAGYYGGRTDEAIMRVVDVVYSIPALLVVIVVAGVVGGGYFLAVALLTVLFSPNDTRLIRAATLEQRPRPYVEAAQALGLSDRKVMVRHIWPNVLPVIVANSFLTFAFALVSIAGLAFVGIGVDPSSPDWGRMLYDGRELIFQNAWTAIAPALAIVLTALSVNLIGDWTFEVLADRGKRP
jgi:peptide/nickel transport system permease protein